MPDLGRSQPIQSHTATEQWRAFEVRMRQRRAERCLIRADVALEAGVLDDAEASIEEARRLDGSVPGLDALAGRLAEARSKRAPRPARRAGAALTTAALVVMAAGAASMMWRGAGEPAVVEPRPSTVAVTPVSRPSVGIVERFVTVPVTTPTEATTAEDESPPPPRPRQSAANETAPVAEAPPRAAEPPPAPVVTARAHEPNTTPPPPPASAEPPPVRIDPVAAPRDLRTADARPSAPPAPAAEPPARVTRDEPVVDVVDDVARVRAVLSRYEAAYSGLDAAAARAVWPAVDERALARAFSGLQSQRVSLERCDVSVSGVSARAECAGRATWVPKVGGSGRTETRRWLFDLRQASGGWQIVSAEAR